MRGEDLQEEHLVEHQMYFKLENNKNPVILMECFSSFFVFKVIKTKVSRVA